MTTDRVGMHVLEAAEARRLIDTHPLHVGRAGFLDADDEPVVLPFNYRTLDDDVVLRTGEGSLLQAVRAGRRIAFQVDHVDPAWEEGWSVLVQGTAREVTDTGELDRVKRLPLRPWAPGEKSHWLRLSTDRISGRRIV